MSNRLGLAVVACLAALLCLFNTATVRAQTAKSFVYVVPIEGTVDLGLAPYLSRVLDEAQQSGAAAVLLEINTFGGRVDAAVAMRDTLLRSPVRTVAFVNQRAISAGALIALACNTLAMAQGGTIGAATPVMAGAGETLPTDEKSVSYVRKEFRATAEARSRPPEFAEAMVDVDVEIEGVITKGKLLTLTTAEALEHGVAEFRADSIEAVLEASGLSGAEIRRTRQTWAETFVRFLTDPIVASLLMSLGILGILVEIRTPGFALPGVVGVTSLALFFWGHWIVQLAGWEELLLLAVGAILIAVEIFVLPGLTVTGVLGVIAIVAGLALSLVGSGATISVFINVLGRVALSILIALIGAAVSIRLLPHLPFGRRLVLQTEMAAEEGYISAPEEDREWLGRDGTALSPLRPAGIADIDGHRVDVVSDGEFINAASSIRVVRVDGNRIVVRRITPAKEHADES
jgi:membrane-bound serine protease (ClpP class)